MSISEALDFSVLMRYTLSMKDRKLFELMEKERTRQEMFINLIPSENYVSRDMLSVIGSALTNKYSEGYVKKRYYPGNAIYDAIEQLAQNRLIKLFRLKNSWRVNVQPLSGSPANLAIYLALMDPGETLMGMALAAGGHLTHGARVTTSGRLFHSVQYGVNGETGLIDYEEVERLALLHQPKVIVSGATAYSRVIDFTRFGAIAKKIGAYHVADISHIAGLVAAGLHPSPFSHADAVMATTHKTLRGPRGAVIFSRTELADRINRVVFPGLQGGPHNNIIAAIALMGFEACTPMFKNYQKQTVKNAAALANTLTLLNFKLITGGTDNHLMLIDCATVKLDGMKAQDMLEAAGITANRNMIPGDQSPFHPSGLRLGTPAVTTRGMKEKEMARIAEWIGRVLIKKESPAKIKKEVEALCRQFPIPYLFK